MAIAPLFFTLLLTFFYQASTIERDYYWRDYSGTIPSDAFIAGKDSKDGNIYVGQAYVEDFGLTIGEIIPGVEGILVRAPTVKNITDDIKILCGSQENLTWLPATAKNLHLELVGKHAVIGGHEDSYGYVNIGRASDQGTTRIGKINSFRIANAQMFLPDGDSGKTIDEFEVLCYENDNNQISKL